VYKADNDFLPSGVDVASVSDCIVPRVLPQEPDWERMNTALHYETPEAAVAAASRAGAEPGSYQIHAARLLPISFDRGAEIAFTLNLGHAGTLPSRPVLHESFVPLGFDVPCIWCAQLKQPGPICDWIPFDCSPLTCNGMWKEHPVNRWGLIDRLEDAIAAARAFAVDEPEPGPFVVVQVLRAEPPFTSP
jgi:hypothetical protein